MPSYLSFPLALLLLIGLFGTVVSAEGGDAGIISNCWRTTIEKQYLNGTKEEDILTDIIFKVGRIDLTASEPFLAFKNRIVPLLTPEHNKVSYESCISYADEKAHTVVTATVHMFVQGIPSTHTTFAVHESPDQVCATGTKPCGNKFEPSYTGGTLEQNFIFDCSNVGGPQSDACEGGLAWASAASVELYL